MKTTARYNEVFKVLDYWLGQCIKTIHPSEYDHLVRAPRILFPDRYKYTETLYLRGRVYDELEIDFIIKPRDILTGGNLHRY